MQAVTRYAKSGGVSIAYTVVRAGAPLDLVLIPGLGLQHRNLLGRTRLRQVPQAAWASFARVILLDKRGTGLSDRVS